MLFLALKEIGDANFVNYMKMLTCVCGKGVVYCAAISRRQLVVLYISRGLFY